jgi:hypothetical protein
VRVEICVTCMKNFNLLIARLNLSDNLSSCNLFPRIHIGWKLKWINFRLVIDSMQSRFFHSSLNESFALDWLWVQKCDQRKNNTKDLLWVHFVSISCFGEWNQQKQQLKLPANSSTFSADFFPIIFRFHLRHDRARERRK